MKKISLPHFFLTRLHLTALPIVAVPLAAVPLIAFSGIAYPVWAAPASKARAEPVIETLQLTPNSPASTARSDDGSAAPNASGNPDQPSMLWQVYQQIQQIQEDLRNLRGKMEAMDDQNDRQSTENTNRFKDLDQRLDQLSGQMADLTANTARANAQAQSAGSNAGATPAAPASSSTLKSVPNSDTPAVASGQSPVSTSATNSLDDADKAAYVAAYEAYRAGGADKAISPMQRFISQYGDSVYVPNAHYWLGEFYLGKSTPDFGNAKKQFGMVVTQYPKTAKAPAATYRLATLADAEHRNADAVRYMQTLVRDYPGTQEATYAAGYLKSNAPAKPAAPLATRSPEMKSSATTTVPKPVKQDTAAKGMPTSKSSAPKPSATVVKPEPKTKAKVSEPSETKAASHHSAKAKPTEKETAVSKGKKPDNSF